MFVELTPECLDQWTAEYQDFFGALMRFAQPLAKCCGYTFEWDSSTLRKVHADWAVDCKRWEKTLLMPDSNGLSHLKMMGLLMYHMANAPWLTNMFEFDFEGSAEADRYEYNGSNENRELARRDMNAGRGAWFGYQFAMMVLNYFEAGRIDKANPHVFRMTYDMEHDFMVYLMSEKTDPMAITLILKGIFLRD